MTRPRSLTSENAAAFPAASRTKRRRPRPAAAASTAVMGTSEPWRRPGVGEAAAWTQASRPAQVCESLPCEAHLRVDARRDVGVSPVRRLTSDGRTHGGARLRQLAEPFVGERPLHERGRRPRLGAGRLLGAAQRAREVAVAGCGPAVAHEALGRDAREHDADQCDGDRSGDQPRRSRPPGVHDPTSPPQRRSPPRRPAPSRPSTPRSSRRRRGG